MKVLFLSQLLPYPLDAGAKVRSYFMLRQLARTHQVTLVCFVREGDNLAGVDHLRTICAEVCPVPMRRSFLRNLRAVVRGVLTGLPMVIVRDEMAEMDVLLRRLMTTGAFDLVHADQTSMAAYGLRAAAQAPAQRPATVLDQHNAVYRLTQRMAEESGQWLYRQLYLREARAFARYEARLCREYDAILTVTAQDKAHLLALFGPEEQRRIEGKLTPVPIAVDPSLVLPVARVRPESDPDFSAPTILHVGTMFWPPNVAGVLWFARQVLPLIWAHVPDARFVVVGKNPPPAVRALGLDPRIEILGYVEEIRPIAERADLFVVPLESGGGMRVKILDAWLWGLPIVSTAIGAEGIPVQQEKNILLADTPDAFAAAAVRLLTDGAFNLGLRRAGRAWVESRYAWTTVYGEVDALYQRLLAPSQGRVPGSPLPA